MVTDLRYLLKKFVKINMQITFCKCVFADEEVDGLINMDEH